MALDPLRPHNDLPPLPHAAEIETRAVLKARIEVRVGRKKFFIDPGLLQAPSGAIYGPPSGIEAAIHGPLTIRFLLTSRP